MEYILVKFSDRYVYIACNSEETTDLQKFCEKGEIIRQNELNIYKHNNNIVVMIF